jgi:hypothetical protein
MGICDFFFLVFGQCYMYIINVNLVITFEITFTLSCNQIFRS